MAARNRPVVAVDFGTSTSLVAERTGRAAPVFHQLHQLTGWMASIAAYDRQKFVVGEQADQEFPDKVIRSVKRAITDNQATVSIAGDELPADNVIVAILNEVRLRSNKSGRWLGRLKELKLGCPAMWTGAQRRRLLELADRASLPVTDATLIDEPVAAGVAWLAHQYLQSSTPVAGRLLVFDMGGGTLDVAVLEVQGGEHPDVRVLASLDTKEAGDHLDDLIARDLTETLIAAGSPPESAPRPTLAAAEVRRRATAAKHALTEAPVYSVFLPARVLGRGQTLRYTREQLEAAFERQMDSAEQLVKAALRAARLSERFRNSTASGKDANLLGDVDYVLLAGGMSRIPYVRRRLEDLFPAAQVVDDAGVEPDQSVAAGLTDSAGYERINLHRPAFDFVLEWDGGAHRRTLYEAYTPLYEPWQLSSGWSRLGYQVRGREVGVPSAGQAFLRAVSPNGQPVHLSFDGAAVGRVPVALGHHELVFKIYCDGEVSLTDGAGRNFSARVDRWPVVRGRDDAQLKLVAEAPAPADPPSAWYLTKDYLPPSMR